MYVTVRIPNLPIHVTVRIPSSLTVKRHISTIYNIKNAFENIPTKTSCQGLVGCQNLAKIPKDFPPIPPSSNQTVYYRAVDQTWVCSARDAQSIQYILAYWFATSLWFFLFLLNLILVRDIVSILVPGVLCRFRWLRNHLYYMVHYLSLK